MMCTLLLCLRAAGVLHAYEGEILVVYPHPITDLVQFLRCAASGDTSPCPAELDDLWHRWLVFPTAYAAFCRRRVGVVVEHVVGDGGPCRGRVIGQVPDVDGLCRGRVKVQ